MQRAPTAQAGLPLELVPELCTSSRSPEAQRPYVLELQSYIANDSLSFLWHYSSTLHNRKTIVRLAEAMAKTVQSLATSESQLAEATLSPNFARSQIDPKDRDRLLDALRSSH